MISLLEIVLFLTMNLIPDNANVFMLEQNGKIMTFNEVQDSIWSAKYKTGTQKSGEYLIKDNKLINKINGKIYSTIELNKIINIPENLPVETDQNKIEQIQMGNYSIEDLSAETDWNKVQQIQMGDSSIKIKRDDFKFSVLYFLESKSKPSDIYNISWK